jgi:hypothetical protein
MLGDFWKEKEKHPFHLFSLSPQTILFEPSFFSLILRFYFTMVLDRYFMLFFIFPWPLNYNHASWCAKFCAHSLLSWFWLNFIFPFFEFMGSCMTTSNGPQSTQVNEELPSESSLVLTLMQHLCGENLKRRKVHLRFEVEPCWTWYYCIFSNFHTVVILLQIEPTSSDELETIYEGCYEIEDTFIFAWFSIFGVGCYRWLCSLICQLLFNNKVDYLICTI